MFQEKEGEEGRATQPMKEKTSGQPPPTPKRQRRTHPSRTHTPNLSGPQTSPQAPNRDTHTHTLQKPRKTLCLLSAWPGFYYRWCYLISFRPKARGAMLGTVPSPALPGPPVNSSAPQTMEGQKQAGPEWYTEGLGVQREAMAFDGSYHRFLLWNRTGLL